MTPPVELKPPAAPPEHKPSPAPDHTPAKPDSKPDPGKKTGGKSGENFYYPTELPPMPANTNSALDKAKNALIAENLEGEQRKSIGQATMPFLVGAAAEITRPRGWFGTVVNAIYPSGIGTAAGKLGESIGKNIGFGVQFKDIFSTFAATGATAAIATGVLSPTMSIMKRALLGENAWKQAASFMVRKEDGGLISRIIHGGESRMMKWAMFRENRARRQLLRLADQNVDVKDLMLGNRAKVEDLVAEGMMAGATSQMMTELGVNLSPKDQEKMERMNRAYDMAKKIFDAKITTAGQKEIFLQDQLPGLVRNKERALWAAQTALITGVGVIKSVSMVGFLQMITDVRINKLIDVGKDVGIGVGKWLTGVTGNPDIATWVSNALRPPAPAIGAGPPVPPAPVVPPVRPWGGP